MTDARGRGVSRERQNRAVNSAFPLATGKQPGYRPNQVDEFLDRARATYEQPLAASAGVTSAEIRHTAFGLKRNGYSARHVDAAMDRLEEVFYDRERRARMAQHLTQRLDAYLAGELEEVPELTAPLHNMWTKADLSDLHIPNARLRTPSCIK